MSQDEALAQTMDRLRAVGTATVSMQLLKRGLRRTSIAGVKPLTPGQGCVVGEAYTLRFLPLREDLSDPSILGAPGYGPRAAIEECPPGAILAVEARGISTTGSLGDILAARLAKRGVAAVVADGAVRDGVGVTATGLPIWCLGTAAPASLTEMSGGGVQGPIACGNVTIFPGDILVCDGDGVVVVPRKLAHEVAADAVEQDRFERWVQARVEEGRPTIGLYPPNPETKAEYDAWKASGASKP
ncbi:Dimethylmenaquinone methyltransferase [alpha proteobacterium BAL199]|jgi:regulator of RNase E activity RraA|nr:Dimethylmenaquinone methyltransferase [alpha proteobacterium BAL199]